MTVILKSMLEKEAREWNLVSALVLADLLDEMGEDSRVWRLLGTMRYSRDMEALDKLFNYPEGTCCRLDNPSLYPFGNSEEYALKLISWAEEHKVELDKIVKDRRLKEERLKKAREGDVDALLAIPEARNAIYALINGKNIRPGIYYYTSSRKAIKEAKKRLSARKERRVLPKFEESNRILVMLLGKRKEKAIELAYEYHNNVKKLFASKRAWIEYGSGGKENADFPYKGNRKFIARWKNAGVRFDNIENPKVLILENHLGNIVARIPYSYNPEG